MLTPSQAWNKVHSSGVEYDIKARIYGCYQHLMGQDGLMDFDDVLIKGVQVLNTAGNLKQVQKQYKHIIVDEAQDLNPVQHTFLWFDCRYSHVRGYTKTTSRSAC